MTFSSFFVQVKDALKKFCQKVCVKWNLNFLNIPNSIFDKSPVDSFCSVAVPSQRTKWVSSAEQVQ